MRLLTLPVTIVRIPVEFGFAAAKRAAKLAQGLVGGGKETVVEEPSAKPARRRGPPPRVGRERPDPDQAGEAPRARVRGGDRASPVEAGRRTPGAARRTP